MAYPNYFPTNYQPHYPQYQQQQQMMTPPTIHAEIVQVDDEKAAANYPVGAGVSQMMIARDETAIFVKTALANGQYQLEVFAKRPAAPAEPPFDPAAYVRRDEIDAIVAAAVSAHKRKKGDEEKEA